MKISVILTIVLNILASTLNSNALKPFMVDGENEIENELESPFLVEIWGEVKQGLRFICGGVILNEGLILTTASCVDGPTLVRHLQVWPNDEDLSSVKRAVIHPGWDKNSNSFANDLAILVLQNELKLTPGKIEIATLSESEGVNVGDIGLVPLFIELSDYSEVVQTDFLAFTVAPDENCKEKFESMIPEQQFCAGSASDSVYDLDNGSPFIASDGADPSTQAVLGLVSKIENCADAGSTCALFAKLEPHLEWIVEQMDIATTTEILTTMTTEEPSNPGKSTQGGSTGSSQMSDFPSENPLPTSTVTEPPTTNNGFKLIGQSVWIVTIFCSLLLK